MTREEFDKRFRRAKYSIIAIVALWLLVVISYLTVGGVSWWILFATAIPMFQIYGLLATKCASCSKPLDEIAHLKGKASGTAKLSDLSTMDTCPHCGEAFFDAPD